MFFVDLVHSLGGYKHHVQRKGLLKGTSLSFCLVALYFRFEGFLGFSFFTFSLSQKNKKKGGITQVYNTAFIY